MRALEIKMLRMLWTLKGQGAAIALVMAAGVATFVMALSALDSLRLTQDRVYLDQRFADIFADLMRAPLGLANRLQEVSGVGMLETRVVAPLNVRLPMHSEPITGLALSIPDGAQPELNRLFLKAGQLPEVGRDEEILVSEAFAEAHHLQPGDELAVVINGRYRTMRISGLALSPEYAPPARALARSHHLGACAAHSAGETGQGVLWTRTHPTKRTSTEPGSTQRVGSRCSRPGTVAGSNVIKSGSRGCAPGRRLGAATGITSVTE